MAKECECRKLGISSEYSLVSTSTTPIHRVSAQRTLFTPSSSIRVYEKRPQYEHSPPSRPSSSLPPVFKRVCQLDRVSDSPEPRVTLFSCPPGFHFLYGRPISPETTVPQRLSRLSSLMNNEARGFLYGPSSQQLDLDTWHGNVRRPCCKDSPDADSRLALESSPDKPECGHCTCCQRRRDRPGTIESKVGL